MVVGHLASSSAPCSRVRKSFAVFAGHGIRRTVEWRKAGIQVLLLARAVSMTAFCSACQVCQACESILNRRSLRRNLDVESYFEQVFRVPVDVVVPVDMNQEHSFLGVALIRANEPLSMHILVAVAVSRVMFDQLFPRIGFAMIAS